MPSLFLSIIIALVLGEGPPPQLQDRPCPTRTFCKAGVCYEVPHCPIAPSFPEE